VTVAAIMTAPRHEITFARNIIDKAFREVGIPIGTSGGVFYGQCMQVMLGNLVKGGKTKYAITIDFDSMFTARDIRRLIRWMIERPDIHAITGVQCKRGRKGVLGTTEEGTRTSDGGREILSDGSPIKAYTAHFGLTVIDLERLALMPKPWFLSQPAPDGDWGDGKIDDDIYFWTKWKECGNTVYIDPMVRLGHMEEMVSMYGDDGEIRHFYPSEWERTYGSGDTSALETLQGRAVANGSASGCCKHSG
jgi:hypothetical protein